MTISDFAPKTQPFSRRGFLAGAAGSLILMGRSVGAQDIEIKSPESSDVEAFAPDFFVSIAPNGAVTIVAHRSEMGTGIRTGLPRVVADELEADWSRVVIQQAPGDKRLGDQNTDGSNSIRFFFKRMRIAGATARTMLERAAADIWGVSPDECFADNHTVRLRQSDRVLGFGDLTKAAAKQPVPNPESLKLKPRSAWRYIGKDAPITDLEAILTGRAIYGIDARMDNQLYCVIARPPVVGGVAKSFDGDAARQVDGVQEVVAIPRFEGAPHFKPLGGVAVCATSTWAAIQGRDALKIEWDDGVNADYHTSEFAKMLRERTQKPGKVIRTSGNAPMAISQSKNVVKADYSVPHLAHAPMETPCAVADIKTDAAGKVVSAHILTATQNPQAVQQAVGSALNVKPEDVLVHVTLLGSGFGRKSKPDYCVEAALLSKQLKRPVHVTWTREDDIRHDYFHAISAIHAEAALDENGRTTAWLQRAAYPTIMSTFTAGAKTPASFELEMGLTDVPFDLPNIQVESGEASAHARIGWLRSVCHIQQNFAVGCFADELAHRAKRDPYEYLLELLGPDRHVDLKAAGLSNRRASPTDYPYDVGRLKNVLRRVAKNSHWDRAASLPKGTGLGIACCRAFLGYTAHVVEVRVSKEGQVDIPNVWVSLDAGTIVSPDRVRAQVEGAAIMATTHSRFGEVTFSGGKADQSNYDDYVMSTMSDSPRAIHVDLVDSTAPPAGVGETTVPSFAPALCNAIFAATGNRVRDLPLANHDLSWS